MSDPAPRFQFSLADIFAALVSLALPAALLTTIDLDDLDNPEGLPVAVIAGFFLGLFSAVQYRRAWNSRSVWFVPPFMLFVWSLFLLPYGSMRMLWPTFAMVIYVIAFLSTALCVYYRKTNGHYLFAVGMIGILGGCAMAFIFSPGFPSNRRGMNETSARVTLKALAESQELYHFFDYDGDGVMEYSVAMRGLFETKPGAADIAIIDRALADADATLPSPQPVRGYLFRLLTAQSANQPAGPRHWFDAKGNLTGGYAFVAYPARYKKTGFSTFMINSAGTILQKDLGPQTEAIVKAMTVFDPDSSWVPSE